MRKVILTLCLIFLATTAVPASAQDVREIVPMPEDVRNDMLVAMRDHVIVLDTIISHLSFERFREAADLAENRLRASPFDSDKEALFNRYLTADMRDADADMRHAGIRLAGAIRKLGEQRDYSASRGVSAALAAVTNACVTCHAQNRLR